MSDLTFKKAQLFHALMKMSDIVDDNHGNVSVRWKDGADQGIVIKPSGMPYDEIGLDDLVIIDMDGDWDVAVNDPARGNTRKPSVDLPNHLAIYGKYPQVEAICHTHSPYVVAFAAAGQGIMCCTTEQADRFGGNIYCNEFVEDPDGWGAKVDLDAAGCTMRAALLEYHGGLTFAKDPVTAVQRAGYLEDIAKKTWLAQMIMGQQGCMLTRQVQTWHERYEKKYGQS